MEVGKMTAQLSILLLWAKAQGRDGFGRHYALASLFAGFHCPLQQGETWPSAVCVQLRCECQKVNLPNYNSLLSDKGSFFIESFKWIY